MRNPKSNYDEDGRPHRGRYTWPAVNIDGLPQTGEIKHGPRHEPIWKAPGIPFEPTW